MCSWSVLNTQLSRKKPSLALEQYTGLAVLQAEFGGRISVAPKQLNQFLVQHLIPYLEYFLLQGYLKDQLCLPTVTRAEMNSTSSVELKFAFELSWRKQASSLNISH